MDADAEARRQALVRSIAAWLPTMSEDELRELDTLQTEILVRTGGACDRLIAAGDTGPIDRIEVGLAELRNAAPEIACPHCAALTDAEGGC